MRGLTTYPLLLVLLVAPVRAASGAPRAPRDDERLAAIRAPLSALMARLQKQGIDVTPLHSKVREGLAKGVPPRRLLQVVRRYGDHLAEGDRVVRRLYKRKRPRGVVRAYADARLAGVKRKPLGRLLKIVTPQPRRPHAVVTVDALTDLLSRGYLTRAAYRMVLELARKGRFEDILRLRGTLARVRKRFGLSAPRAGVELQKALDQASADLPRALDRLDQQLPVVDPATSTRGVPTSSPGRGSRGP